MRTWPTQVVNALDKTLGKQQWTLPIASATSARRSSSEDKTKTQKDEEDKAQRPEGAAAPEDKEAQRPEGAAAPKGRTATTTSEPDRAKGTAAQRQKGAAAKRTESAA